ncbi:hypothetical protein RB1830 [Rhodopirellula baltica SH 1]|uniref:Uncharacterized protein n=1 Tax=Rhodopirellula baltica (strain DSM 10527 / NCIMB 13988 / SH1) TaxID=243090 RepID=Q7UWS6_RHOBA|nr:hypothetical protein RB1830 [Rhodopirellula baltica SH 1]
MIGNLPPGSTMSAPANGADFAGMIERTNGRGRGLSEA